MAVPWDDDSEQTSFFHEESPASPIADGFQNTDNLANIQQWPADEWCFSSDDECQSTELWIEVASTEQALIANGPPNVVQEDVIVDWWEGYEDPLVPDFEWSGPIQPNAPPLDQPPADAWQDEDSEDFWLVEDVLGADVIPAAAIVVEDAWSFEADYVESSATAEGFQNADVVAPTDLVSPDAWTWDDDVPDEFPDDAVLGADSVAPATQPVDPDWTEEDGAEDYELQIDDFANFEIDPPQADAWDWDGEAVEDGLDTDQVLGADAAQPVTQSPDSDWDWDSGNLDESSLDDQTLGADVIPPQPDLDWDFTESSDDDWAFDEAQQSPPVVTADQHFGEDAENWDDSTVDESDGTRPDDYALVDSIVQPVQIFDDPWDWDADTELLEPDAQTSGDVGTDLVADPWDWTEDVDAEVFGLDAQLSPDVIAATDLAQPDSWDWDQDATESADEFSAPVGSDYIPPPSQFTDYGWEWNWDGDLAEVEDHLDSPIPSPPIIYTFPAPERLILNDYGRRIVLNSYGERLVE